MNIYTYPLVLTCKIFSINIRNWIAGSNSMYIFTYIMLKYFPKCFHTFNLLPLVYKCSVFKTFYTFTDTSILKIYFRLLHMQWFLILFLVYIFLITNAYEHLFVWFLAISISSSVKWQNFQVFDWLNRSFFLFFFFALY